MSRHDPVTALRHIFVYANEAVTIVEGRSREDLDQDRLLNLALTRLLEVIGEAANRVPYEIQAKYPELPWFEMISLRNRLIHGYDSVDFDILWVIVRQDLPDLIQKLQNILDT